MQKENFDNFDFDNEYEKMKRETSKCKPNILVCGATGVGKSSVINFLFGEEVANVGEGKAVTRGIHEYKSDGVDVVLYDSEGYEIGNEAQSKFKEDVVGFIEQRIKNTDVIEEQIHLVWYCISAGNKRITDLDIDTVNEFSDKGVKFPVIFMLPLELLHSSFF
ncbi:MAG: GTPase [Alkaliphilus sp.]